MPDFTICKNKDCPIQDSCHRYLAEPDTYQAFDTFYPVIDEQGNFVDCDFFKPLPEFKHKKDNNFRNFNMHF